MRPTRYDHLPVAKASLPGMAGGERDDRRPARQSGQGSAEFQAQLKLRQLYNAAEIDFDLRADLLQFWAQRQAGEGRRPARTAAVSPAATGTAGHRGAITAAKRSAKPCLCGSEIKQGELIVKRWNQWIHDACYETLQAAKSASQ